ncbi:MAG: hypothetical protein ABI723_09900 [Bacteroidia bacterium]
MVDVKNIIFDKDGGPLKVNFKFKGIVGASYTFTLWEAKTNAIAMESRGNNLNDDDDNYNLPGPAIKNADRLIELDTLLKGLDQGGKYSVIVEVYQDEKLLESDIDKGEIKAGEAKQSFIYVRLITLNVV